MAHSIQGYRGKVEVINDLDLLVVIGFAVKVIQRSPEFLGLGTFAAHMLNGGTNRPAFSAGKAISGRYAW